MAGISLASGIGALGGLTALNPYTAGISAIAPIAKGIKGVSDLVKAKKLRDAYDQPTYNIPGAQTEALGLAKSAAYDQSIAGQSQIEGSIDRNIATGNRRINEAGMSSAEKLAAINANVGAGLDAYGQIATQVDNQQQRDQAALRGELGTMAGFQDKQWQLNKQQPWMDAMDAANRLDDAGTQNIFSGINDLASVGAATISKGGPTPVLANKTTGVNPVQTQTPYTGGFNPNMELPTREPMVAPSLTPETEAARIAELESIREIENSTVAPMITRKPGTLLNWQNMTPENRLKYGKDFQLKSMGAY